MTDALYRARKKFGRLEEIPPGTLLKGKYPVTGMEYRISSDGRTVLTRARKLNPNLDWVEYEGDCWQRRALTAGQFFQTMYPVRRSYYVGFLLLNARGAFGGLKESDFGPDGQIYGWKAWFRNGDALDFSEENMELVTASEKQMRVGERHNGFSATRMVRDGAKATATTLRTWILEQGLKPEDAARKNPMTRREIGLMNWKKLGRIGRRWAKEKKGPEV